jgi:glycosylphosphatidylinositol transamidase (GPIT) subunit GPI8
MCKTNRHPPTGIGKCHKYKKNICEHYNHIAQTDNYEQFSWIGFLETDDEENTNLCLMHDWFATVKDHPLKINWRNKEEAITAAKANGDEIYFDSDLPPQDVNTTFNNSVVGMMMKTEALKRNY